MGAQSGGLAEVLAFGANQPPKHGGRAQSKHGAREVGRIGQAQQFIHEYHRGVIRPLAILAAIISTQAAVEWRPSFTLVQPELFAATGGNSNAWADIDNDGDLDYFVGFRGRPSRFYPNDQRVFVEVRSAFWRDATPSGS